MERILVSACLLGRAVRFDGRAKTINHEIVARWRDEGRLVPFCPEVVGGLPVPRPPAEIEGAQGARAVLAGQARIRTRDGRDVTAFFLHGAQAALRAAQEHGVRLAVLKEKSPSCGVHQVFDGSFTGTTVPGMGLTTLLLRDHGIDVFTEHELPQAQARLTELETSR
ncbi:DUF523 domain-containing protein [Thermobifida fusca]|jgi:uncharacterized protein YbbK (DUF523 family)|uniref:Purine nucleoside phosphorylase n=2 Tax=Thermobifida fusca TaxID=2021 RepID=A0A9P2TB17_THEFU|nr:DUF523 domain-containing protein [Thermobifida fusca]AAZ55249.1 conserved hypothetical protein [Thermobifida fusca YX]EOR71712.1 hypothetical protein TM51_06472 [Thermobifida fusca TM51]MDD6791350.1 DUF523 domain-containing protein [Thermobifida fusca]QOS57858.1 DUF523 domain-containing protein [Thermobifida fusca]